MSSEDGNDKFPRKADTIIITGKPENCQSAKQALMVSESNNPMLLGHSF